MDEGDFMEVGEEEDQNLCKRTLGDLSITDSMGLSMNNFVAYC